MGKHQAPDGQAGRLPSGAELTRTSDETGRHRVSRPAGATSPELEPVTPRAEHVDGWRH
jgi:hypothetical protein